MADLSYSQVDLVLAPGCPATDRQVRDFQHDLRQLGYLPAGIDGRFGSGTQAAVRALQYDLLNNQGRGNDGAAPVSISDYNRGRVAAVTGQADQSLVACISDMLDDSAFPKLPSSDDPARDNQGAIATVTALPPDSAPIPFLFAIMKQESDLQHFRQPPAGDEDSFVTIGLDRNLTGQPNAITSRGYGLGQYTLFHHPPSAEEVAGFISDVAGNVSMAAHELRAKFDGFVNGPADTADDRQSEIGNGPLRPCKYDSADGRYLRDCRQCALDAGTQDVTLAPTQYYANGNYQDVPVRAKIGCDWPYAVRRYNGSGINSYHYQVRILKNLAAGVGQGTV